MGITVMTRDYRHRYNQEKARRQRVERDLAAATRERRAARAELERILTLHTSPIGPTLETYVSELAFIIQGLDATSRGSDGNRTADPPPPHLSTQAARQQLEWEMWRLATGTWQLQRALGVPEDERSAIPPKPRRKKKTPTPPTE